jgi:hypothetical protein
MFDDWFQQLLAFESYKKLCFLGRCSGGLKCLTLTLLQVITQFLKLETILDDSVNSNIELQIERGGASKSLTLSVRVL